MTTINWQISTEPVPYLEAIEAMEDNVAAILDDTSAEKVWLLEHPPLYTAGTSANDSDLLDKERFPVYQTGRGGQYTYHGPGQRVAYVMLDLQSRDRADLKQYVINLEQWLINSLKHFDIDGQIRDGRVGIWVKDNKGGESKIAAIGIRVRKWISYHGISLNINPDLSHFSGIVPCGINQHGVTSLKELGVNVSTEEVDSVLKQEFSKIF